MADIRDLLVPPGGRGSKRWKRRLPRPSRIAARDIWLAIVLGVIGGLVYAQYDASPRPTEDAFAEYRDKPVPNPWAESARSRAILEGQEGVPPSAFREAYGGGDSDSRRTERVARVRVVDGDTFWAGGEKVRIADIDTPEVAARCPAEARLAARATQRTRELLAGGGWQMHATGGQDRDRYGRKLRTITKDGRSIGDTLVAEGLARPYRGGRRSWC